MPIKDERLRAGLSQSGLSRESGVPIRTIQHWEQGHIMDAKARNLKKVADALGCAVDELIGDGQLDETEAMRTDEEDKELFVRRLNDALVECGASRYDHLTDAPLRYERVGVNETVRQGSKVANVTGDSLAALACDVCGKIL